METKEELLRLGRLRVGAAARLCGVSRRTVERWVRRGVVRVVRVGSVRQVVVADLPVAAEAGPAPRPARAPGAKARSRWNAAALADL